MNILYTLILILGLALLALACSSTSKGATPTAGKDDTPLVRYEQKTGRCLTCANYTLVVWNDGTALFNGISNTEQEGEHTFRVSGEDMETLRQALEKSDFKKLEEFYTTEVRDLPVSVIEYGEKRVRFQQRACPGALKGVLEVLERASAGRI